MKIDISTQPIFFVLVIVCLLGLPFGCNDDDEVVEEPTVCQVEPLLVCDCPNVFDPVCGCDDMTYRSECEANCAGVQIFTEGECD